jgi:hypothetical protein
VTNAGLKREGDELLKLAGLRELLAAYDGWFVGGSYSYDLMCWRDLDIYVLDSKHDLKSCFSVAYCLTERLAARKSRFTNNLGEFQAGPCGFYWGIKLGDSPFRDWKLDLWFLAQEGYDNHIAYSALMRQRLTDESRRDILSIKEVYWRRKEYRDSITSDLIYGAVLDAGARTLDDFEEFLRLNRR